MVIRPGLLAAHCLDGMDAHDRLQTAVMPLGQRHRLARVVHHVPIIFNETIDQFLRSHEHGAVLMAHGKADGACLVLESLEVLRAVGAVDAALVAVVVDVPPVAGLSGARPLSKILGERLRRLTPRAVGTVGKGHLDVTHGARIVFHYHHVVFRPTFHQCGIDGREARIIEKLCLSETLEVACGHVVEAVVVLRVFLIVGEAAWHA